MPFSQYSIGIVADDLTGANDVALPFCERHIPVTVALRANTLSTTLANLADNTATAPASVLSCNTESRNLPQQEAVAAVQTAVDTLKEKLEIDRYYKKIDSTLRGHVVSESLAMADALGYSAVLLVPAYPEQGRQTIGGYHLVHGLPLERTDVARDPGFPIRESYLPELLSESLPKSAIGYIPLLTVMQGAGPLLKALQEQLALGKRMILVDAAQSVDLEQLALVYEKLYATTPLLPCGSAGFAQALARYWFKERPHRPDIPSEISFAGSLNRPLLVDEQNFPPRDAGILVVSGSNTRLTRQQLHGLHEHYTSFQDGSDIALYALTPQHLLEDAPLEDLAKRMAEQWQQGHTVVVTSAWEETALPETQQWARTIGMPLEQVSEQVEQTLGSLVARIFKYATEGKVVDESFSAVLVSCGGETTAACCHALNLAYVEQVEVLAPAIPLTRAYREPAGENGPAVFQWLVTKSGNFGTPETLYDIVRRLKTG